MRSLAAEHVAVPAALKTAVASQIRRLIADVWYTLQLSDGGAIRIAARVVARIARDAARDVPGVRVAFGRSTQSTTADQARRATLRHHHPHAAVGVGGTAVVDLAIAVEYGDRLDVVAREVQQRAIAELRAQAGLQDVAVNVTVDDVITRPRSPPTGTPADLGLVCWAAGSFGGGGDVAQHPADRRRRRTVIWIASTRGRRARGAGRWPAGVAGSQADGPPDTSLMSPSAALPAARRANHHTGPAPGFAGRGCG